MTFEIDLTGRTALVTGASRGIGRAIATSLAAAGARVAIAARSADALNDLAEKIGSTDLVFPCDLATLGAGGRLAAEVNERLGGVDVLVNNAGISGQGKSERASDAFRGGILQLNLASVLELIAGLGPGLLERRGSVVNVTSIAALTGTPFNMVYSASKGGLDAVTRALACEWGDRGVRVNSVAPGCVITEMMEPILATPGFEAAMVRSIPLRRGGLPEEVASVVTFLASDLAGYVTGQTIAVDGGITSVYDGLRAPA